MAMHELSVSRNTHVTIILITLSWQYRALLNLQDAASPWIRQWGTYTFNNEINQ